MASAEHLRCEKNIRIMLPHSITNECMLLHAQNWASLIQAWWLKHATNTCSQLYMMATGPNILSRLYQAQMTCDSRVIPWRWLAEMKSALKKSTASCKTLSLVLVPWATAVMFCSILPLADAIPIVSSALSISSSSARNGPKREGLSFCWHRDRCFERNQAWIGAHQAERTFGAHHGLVTSATQMLWCLLTCV